MPDDFQHVDASVANSPDTLSSASPGPENFPFQAPDTADNGVAGDAELTALADDLEYHAHRRPGVGTIFGRRP